MKRYVAYLCLASALLFACSPAAEAPKTTDAPAPAAAPEPPKDMLSGTWVINVAKSTYSPADLAPKSGTSVLTATADSVHVVTDGVDSKGRKTHTDYTAKFDGVAVPTNATADGKPNPDASDGAAWKKIDEFNFETTASLKGKVLGTTKVVIAPDGKSRTNTATGKNAQGKDINNVTVFEKQ